MKNRDLELYSFEDHYQVEGNSHVVIWRSKGDVVIDTPEIGFRCGLDGKAITGFSLDEKTQELFVQFLQSGTPNQIGIGTVKDYKRALDWVKAVNKLYNR